MTRRGARRRRNPAPSELYLGVLENWRERVGPRVARQLAQLARRYEILIRKIDRDYEIGRTHRIEEKEHVAEELRDRLEALEEQLNDAGESMAAEAETSVEEELATRWARHHDPKDYLYRAPANEFLGALRDIVETSIANAAMAGGGAGEGARAYRVADFRVTDHQLRAAAKDAYERQVRLRAKLRPRPKSNPIPLADTPFREGEVRVTYETREPRGSANPGLWSFLLWVTTDALRRLKILRKVNEDTRGFNPDPDGPWRHVGVLWLRSWPDTPELYIDASRVHPALHGRKLGVYLYSFAADVASAMNRPIVSSVHDRSKQAEQLWKSKTLRRHYHVEEEGAHDVLTTRSGPRWKKRRIPSMGELSTRG